MRAPSTEGTDACSSPAGASSSPAGRPTAARIDLTALAHNLGQVVSRIGGRKVLAVVKAQAYGHGAVPVAKRLVELGVPMLGVALVEEGRELRASGIPAPVLIMGPIFPEQAPAVVDTGLTPVVFSLPVARALSEAAQDAGKKIAVHVKIDTGMGRIGLVPEEAVEFISGLANLPGIAVEGLMTHFADADLRDKEFAGRQLERFSSLIAALERRGIAVPLRHAANSAAVLDYDRAHLTMVRPGLMLYGYNPLEGGSAAELRPVLSLATRIAHVKRVPAGVPISYGRTFVTRRESLIATIPIGYADGFNRLLSNTGRALVRGRRVSVAGRVCMDMTMLDVTDVPGVSAGDDVVLIGSQGAERITAQDIAETTGTIPYEVLCAISARVPRIVN
ncbi:MAG: alanine racemase [Nitrospiraceae bacterium]|nr:alanine racemase [Nitrospiraceae bacterium]